MSTQSKARDTVELCGEQNNILMKVRTFVRENFLYLRPPDFELGVDDRLLERGVIDSMGAVELLAFIEDEFGVVALEDEISEANLGSLRAIAEFIAKKQAAAA